MSPADKRRTFRALHQSGCFVIPNPWNIGSARYLQGLGFKALATTSSGYAHSQGYADGDAIARSWCSRISARSLQATDVPVNADFEDGFADDPDWRRRECHACASRPASPDLSIEDFTGDRRRPALRFRRWQSSACGQRATAIDKAGGGVVFTARTEGFIQGRPDLD